MNVRKLMMCGVFAGVSALISPWSVPIFASLVPINFVHISVFVCSGLLGCKYGTISQSIFVLLGAVGLPVFSRFSGGLDKLLGPTGGYIFGYIACAALVGCLTEVYGYHIVNLVIAMTLGMIVTHICGLIWLKGYVKGYTFGKMLIAYVLPYVPGDTLKIILSAFLINRLKVFRNLLAIAR